MLSFFTRTANLLFPYRRICHVFILVLAVVIALTLAEGNSAQQEQRLVAYFLGLVWMLLLNLMLSIFYQPASVEPAVTWFLRMKQRLLVFIQRIIVILFFMLSLSVIYLTIKLIRI